jgi:Tfp pilus assembly protein FimT
MMGLESLESRQLFSITASLVNVPISQAAIAADPTLASCKTYDLQVTLDPGERWIATDMDAELSSGGFYNVSDANGGGTVPVTFLWSQHPQAQFDTFVSGSSFSIPTVLGEFKPLGHTAVFSSTSTDVSWGVVSDKGTGTFTVARLTISNNASGTIVGDLGSSEVDPNNLKPFSFTISNGSVGTTPQLGSISGHVWNDTNGNGKNDEGNGLPGFKIYIDKNNNGKFDSGEKNVLSDANGNYTFPSLTPGTYTVREVLPTGYRRTHPSASSYSVVLSSGTNATGKDFGNTTTALLSGTVFSDKNSNDKLDSGETGISGFIVYIDSNNNGKLDSGEKTAGTDANGYWVFKALKSGTYVVRIQSRTGYKTIGTSSISIKMASGASYTGRLFAEHKTS